MRLNIKTSLLSMLLVAGLGFLVISFMALVNLKQNLLDDRKFKVKNLVESYVASAEYHHNLVRDGKLSKDEAQKEFFKQMDHVRYDGDNYFFGFNSKHVYVLFPGKPELIGVDRTDYQDKKGAYFVRDLVKNSKNGEGFTNYWFTKPGKGDVLYEKLSFTKYFEPWDLVLGTGIYIDDVDDVFWKNAYVMIAVSLSVGFVFTLLLLATLRNVFSQIGGEPSDAEQQVKLIANGDLSKPITYNKKYDKSLLFAMENMRIKLVETIGILHSTTDKILDESKHLTQASEEIKKATDIQSAATSNTAAALEQVTVSINEVSEIAVASREASEKTMAAAEQGVQAVKQTCGNIEKLVDTVENATAQTALLVSKSKDINSIAQTIRGIAEQTNLLALNAAIEAARAGDAGRGFAVVADEVRKLAEKTSTSTDEINSTVASIQKESEQTIKVMNEVGPLAKESLSLSEHAVSYLDTIQAMSQHTLEQANDVAMATKEQAQASNEIAGNVENIASMSEQTGATIECNTDFARNLEHSLTELKLAVDFFKC